MHAIFFTRCLGLTLFLAECYRVVEFVCTFGMIKPSVGGVFVTTLMNHETSCGTVDLDMPAAVWIQYNSMAEQRAAKGFLDKSRPQLPQLSLVFSIDHRQACILRLQKILIGCSMHRRCNTMQRFCPWLCILSPEPCCGDDVGQLSACNNPHHYCKNANRIGLSFQMDDIVQNMKASRHALINGVGLQKFFHDFYQLIFKLSSSGVNGKSGIKSDETCINRMKENDFTGAYVRGGSTFSSARVACEQIPMSLQILTYVGSMFANFHSSQQTERLTVALLAKGLSDNVNHGSEPDPAQVVANEMSAKSGVQSDKTPSVVLESEGIQNLLPGTEREHKKQKLFGYERVETIYNCSFCKKFKNSSYDLVCEHERVCRYYDPLR